MRGAEELLPAADLSTAADGDRTAGTPEGRQRTIAQEVVAFLRPRHRAAREEITQHMEATRPGIKSASLRRELSRMVTNGTLTRTGGVYATTAGAALLLGMSRQEIQELPDVRYSAFLEGILQTLRGALAPTA